MAAGHGGARIGAGRKPKAPADGTTPPAPAVFDDPLAYLIAVATGAAPGDSLRVAAAKAALPFTVPKARAPVASPPPAKLRAATERAADKGATDDFTRRAAEVRRRHTNAKERP
jgi:hypothetical protein